MKYILSLLVVLCISSVAQSQDSLEVMELQDVHKQEIEVYKNYWWKKEWPKLRRKYKVKFDCDQCNALALDLRVEVNGEGEVMNVKVVNDKVRCLRGLKRQSLKDAMLQTVRHWEFGDNFYNKVFEFRLGLVVKC